jgi:hypothetical protein
MNERIRELYIQTANETADGKEWAIGGLSNAARFAELIINECGIALSPMLRDMVSRGQAYDMIKEHFGVD